MRVATIFTGVAACTFGAATQVANAQEAVPQAAGHMTQGVGRAIADGKSYGSIRMAENCGEYNTDKEWLHVSTTDYYTTYYWQVVSLCFGYKGLWNSPPFTGIKAECGGNNHGLLVGLTAAGDKWSTGFGPGTTYRTIGRAHLSGVFVNSWTGTDKCPQGPNWGEEG
jgi:hypothetical protein